jgi:hypothetical protein
MTRKEALVNYLRSCVEAGDWHGVCDAANDMRVELASTHVNGPVLYPPRELLAEIKPPLLAFGEANVRINNTVLNHLLSKGWRLQ